MKQLKWEYTVTLLFVACSALLLVLMAIQASVSKSNQAQILQQINNVQSSGFDLQELPSAKFREHEISDFNEILERPLFFAGREPVVLEEIEEAEVAAVVEAKPVEDINQTLIGIINTPAGVYALFHNTRAKAGEPKYERLKQGHSIGGWHIKEIKPDRVIVTADKNEDEILLAKPRVVRKTKKARKTNPFKQKLKK